MKNECIKFQLAPPGHHRNNAAERTICTFNNYLLAGPTICDPYFPITEWDRLLSQYELAMKILWNYIVNPILSEWRYLFGNHDFN